ncbi:5,10-methylene-tetrahydrofolate dehydrogenase [Saccharopolyspora oryzae]|uniref:5,10-methylene-tetrahydrofolate dehydrogenase n=1 Tax=Saccharopolyspora oryzae TaxID=2997343 RepID=A0ABT4V8U3_9PSEU|nr:5,10-methylene-tetrahydrofolate dehydrogenase [Saccharopolyspora oryzae]MDA3630386.1 5,10-methylene-tetrahydrofolate dehydrogenase [Saccharopolyspora oryzae]
MGRAVRLAEQEQAERVLGLVTDPDMPAQVGYRTSEQITEWLSHRTGERWTIDVRSDPLTADHRTSEDLLDAVDRHRDEQGWDFGICLTDLPLLLAKGALLADVSTGRRVALVSLPALGAIRTYHRTYRLLTRLLDDLLPHHLSGPPTDPGTVRRTHRDGPVDVRYTTPRLRGWVRLVSGMVRANRPWQLVWGLSSALAAALAAAGFGLFTSTVWQLGDVLSPLRALTTSVFALSLMTVWLIASHGLWERVGRRAIRDRRLALLYNTSTITTLSLGVACLYALVYLVSLAGAATLLDAGVLARVLGHPVDWAAYARLAWMVASMALVAGALGSSLETDAAVRQAAYGYREEQRRAQHAEAG